MGMILHEETCQAQVKEDVKVKPPTPGTDGLRRSSEQLVELCRLSVFVSRKGLNKRTSVVLCGTWLWIRDSRCFGWSQRPRSGWEEALICPGAGYLGIPATTVPGAGRLVVPIFLLSSLVARRKSSFTDGLHSEAQILHLLSFLCQ